MSDFIPGGNTTYSKQRAHYPPNFPQTLAAAAGASVYDAEGHEWIDTTASLGAILLGYANEHVDDAVQRALDNGGPLFPLPTLWEHEAAQAICQATGWEQVKFGKNGSDATEAAVRLARWWGWEHALSADILTNSYHGFHSDLVTSTPDKDGGILRDCRHAVTRCEQPQAVIDYLLDKDTEIPCALLMEPVSPTIRGWPWQEIKDQCDKVGTLLIFDEILSGFRFGVQGGMGWVGVRPHLACYGKALANGYPLSCVAGPRELMQHFERDVFFSGTYMEETFSLAACTATLGQLTPQLYEDLWRYGETVMALFHGAAAFQTVQAKAKGFGVRFQLEFAEPAQRTAFVAAMCDEGFLLGRDWFVTAAMVQEVDLDTIAAAFDTALAAVCRNK